jgi:hypothetical protein
LSFHLVVSLDSSRSGLALRSFFSFCILVTRLKQSITLHLSYKRASCCYLKKKRSAFVATCVVVSTWWRLICLSVQRLCVLCVCAYNAVFWFLWHIVCTRSCWRNKT